MNLRPNVHMKEVARLTRQGRIADATVEVEHGQPSSFCPSTYLFRSNFIDFFSDRAVAMKV